MSKSTTAKVIATCLIVGLSMQMCCSSAIPIWEFLTRNEKMSYLYSTFAQLVSVHCKATAARSPLPVNQCKRNLLTYGYEKLQTFSNEQLDVLDPYQHGASELIWSSIMREHPSATSFVTTREISPVPTPPATSIIILTRENPTETANKVTSEGNSNSPNYPKNPIFEANAGENKNEYAMDMDIAYGYPTKSELNPSLVEIFSVAQKQQEQQPEENEEAELNGSSNKPETYLTGPHVIRVRPDGTPVDEDRNNPIPSDDDLEGFQINTAVLLPPTPAVQIVHAAAGRPTKHRKIATISALKQQYLSSLALQQQLQPPLEQPVQELQPPLERSRRQYPAMVSPLGAYFTV